jgi:hypothetical protein
MKKTTFKFWLYITLIVVTASFFSFVIWFYLNPKEIHCNEKYSACAIDGQQFLFLVGAIVLVIALIIKDKINKL